MGWCCYCRCYYCCCYRCCPLCHCCCADIDTVDNVRREPVSVYSPGVGMLYTLFPSWNAYVQTMGARCHVIPECTRYYMYLYQSMIHDTRYQVLDKHAPRIPAPNISCCSIIVAVAAASATILTLRYNSTSRPNRIPVLVPGMTTRVRQTKSILEHKRLHPNEALRMPLASRSPAAKR